MLLTHSHTHTHTHTPTRPTSNATHTHCPHFTAPLPAPPPPLQAVLVSNPNSEHGDLIAKLDKRINGFQTAKDYVMLTYNVLKEFLDQAKTITPGLSSPTVMVLAPQGDGSEWVSVTAMTKKKVVAEAMDQLEEIGATGIAVMPIENCRQ